MKNELNIEDIGLEIDGKVWTDQEGEEYVAIATKLRKDEYIKLCKIAEKNGNSKYAFLQWAVSMIIRLMDFGGRISNDLTKACIAFGVETKFSSRFNMCLPSVEVEVESAIFFVGNRKMKGLQPIYVEKPFMGEAVESENIMDMIDKLLLAANPALHKKMMREVKRRGVANVYHLLVEWTNECDGVEDLEEIESMFSDNERSEWGKTMADGPYRRTMVNTKTSDAWMERQGRLEFGD